MQSEFLTPLQNDTKDKFVNNNNNNNNKHLTALPTNKRSSSKLNSHSHKPVILNNKPDHINHSEQNNDSTKDLLSPGDLVKDRWRVICKLGGGGFGEIYEAVDTKLKRVQHSSSTSSTSSYYNESQSNLKRYHPEYSLCLNCATNTTLNIAVNSPPNGQNGPTVIKLKHDIGSDSGIGGVQAFSSDTQIQHGTRINSAGTTTSASLSSRRLILTCNENNPNKNKQEDGLIHLKSSATNNYPCLNKINSQDFSASNASTPRDSSQTGNADKKSMCINCKCELPQKFIEKFTLNNKHESNGISTDSGISSINEVYDYRVAIKAESNRQARQVLRMEVAVLRRLQGKPNICRLFGCGKNAKFNYMVMTLQGKNLSEIRRTLPGAVFTLGTAFRLIKQCITALKSLHDAGFLHRDVKPSNFAIQRGESREGSLRVEVTLLDFGLARPYTVNGPGTEVRNARQVAGFRGTVRYASINAHAHQDLARRDDLWSLVYMFIEFVCGQLPWRRIRDKELVGQMKMALNHRELAIKSGLPVDIVTVWITHLEQLEYKSVPNYEMLITCLDEWLIQHRIQESDFYDWEIPKTNSLTDDTKIQQAGTITLYKADHKGILSEKFSHKEVRMQQLNSQLNVEDIVGKQHSGREENKVKEDEDDDEEEEEEQINKMNETLKPNTLLQVVRDNQMLKMKSSINLNHRHSTSHCNLMTNSRSTAAEISRKIYDGKLLKPKNILKNHGSLGADLSSHDGDMENAIIIEGEYSQNKHNKLSIVHNSADCILIDDEHEDDVKVFTELDLGVDTNDKHSLRIGENEINNLNTTKNSFDNFQKNATTNEEKKSEISLIKSQLPITSKSSLVNVTNNIDNYKNVIDIKTEKPVKEYSKLIYARPIHNNSTEQDLVSGKETVQFIKDRCISGTNLSTKELNQNIQDDKLDVAGQSLFVPTFSGMSSSSLPQTSDCTTNPRAKIHAIIKNLLAGHQSKGNDSPKLNETTQRLPNWSGLVKTPKEFNKFSDTNSSNLDLRVGSDVDKSTCRSNKASVFDQNSPYYIHFSLGHINAHDNEQYHRFLTVPRKDHISLSTLRLNRTGESVTFDRSNPTFQSKFIQESKHSMTTSSDQILMDHMENTCITHNLNSQSENHHPVPRRKRTLYLNKYHSEHLIQPSQNISIKSLNIPQNNHENLIMLTKSSYQNNLPFELTAENYRQKLIDNKQKHSQQKSINSTKLVGQTIRPTLETSKNIQQNRRNTTNINNNNNNSSTDNLRDSESLEKMKQLGLLAKTLDVKRKANNTDTASTNPSYEKSMNQQTFLRSSINGSKINQLSKSQSKCLTRTCSEISYDLEMNKSSVQYDSRSKRYIGKDSMMNTNRSISQSIQQNDQQTSLKSSNLHSTEKLIIRRNDNTREKQNIQSMNYNYSPLKISTNLLTSMSSTNLTDESYIRSKNVYCKSISCQQSIEKSHRRRLNSIHVVPSELNDSQQKTDQLTISTFDNSNPSKNNNDSSSCISKMNLRTLRSQSADRIIKPRINCKNPILQPCYVLQSTLPNTSLCHSKSKRTLGIPVNDSQKTCKMNSFTPVRKL
ncbi:unnamed protein product [Schistosoma spindalis]|nr:unnamed protein product [Schistosoma spindale]